jgi:hypothetical protein
MLRVLVRGYFEVIQKVDRPLAVVEAGRGGLSNVVALADAGACRADFTRRLDEEDRKHSLEFRLRNSFHGKDA